MIDKKLKEIAEKYEIALIYLFGSQADNGLKYFKSETVTSTTDSDLDVAIAFEKPQAETIRTYGILYKEIADIFEPFNIDLIFMHEVDTLFQHEVIKGIRIYQRNELFTDDFEEGIMKRAEDLVFKRRILNNEIMEAIEDGYFEFEYSPNS